MRRTKTLGLALLFVAGLAAGPQNEHQQVVARKNAAAGGGIALDATSSGDTGSPGTTLTWSHTTGSGSNRALYVSIASTNGGTGTSCTYNGVAMTEVWDMTYAGVMMMAGYVLAAPASGAHDIVFTGSTSDDYTGRAASFTGVDQTTPNRTPATASESFATVANAQSGDYVVEATVVYGGTNISVDGGRTVIGALNQNLHGEGVKYGASYVAASGSTSISWTTTGTPLSGGCALIPAP